MQGFIAGAASRSRAQSSALARLLAAGALMLAGAAAQAQTAQSQAAQADPAPAKPAQAQPAAPSFEEIEARAPLKQRYPAGTIHADDVAQQALQEAFQDRNALEIRYILDQRACYQKFLVNDCLEAAKNRKRATEKDIKQVEIEANTWRRQDQVDQRDQSLADQRVKDEQDAARRLEDQKKQQAAATRKVQDSKDKNAQVQQRIDQNQGLSPDARIRAHEAQVNQQQAEEAARAPERAANAAKREQRIRDAEEHKQEVARKKAENERERADKKRQKELEQQQQQQAAPAAR